MLVSATPSLESRLNVERTKLTELVLTERVAGGRLPEGVLVDLREERPQRPGEVHFSPRLMQELESTVAAGDQAIILRNRRGYSPLLLCRACGEKSDCDACGLPRTYHRRFNELLCHYCGSRRPVPERCSACGEEALEAIGTGTERVEEELRDLLPGVRIETLDRDTLRRQGRVVAVLERFARQETQVLVGTQMVSKGHHFPRVALAAVLQADTYLGFPDFRAVERTYALLTQLAGRAGRGERAGKVVIQSYHPDHYAIRAALAHDDRSFAEEEMRFRRIFHYPPYTRMVQLLVRDGHRGRAKEAARKLGEVLVTNPLASGVRILGPAPAPFEKLRGKWRFQLLVRAPSGSRVRALVRAATAELAASKVVVDIDPIELL
jgi:primosomal protein N' (replication factor Y)